jgi:hypothetical protein
VVAEPSDQMQITDECARTNQRTLLRHECNEATF